MKSQDEIRKIKEDVVFEKRLIHSMNKELNNPDSPFSAKDLKDTKADAEKKIAHLQNQLK